MKLHWTFALIVVLIFTVGTIGSVYMNASKRVDKSQCGYLITDKEYVYFTPCDLVFFTDSGVVWFYTRPGGEYLKVREDEIEYKRIRVEFVQVK